MKIKVSDYLAQKLIEAGIRQVFTVTGGVAMHMNDSFGHAEGLKCLYQHHEQACAMAAEAYARFHNEIGVVCVTAGPGAVNAMTGVLCGWMESIPMLVLSGQVRTQVTVRSTGLDIRTMGVQEYDVTRAAAHMTKYAVMVEDKSRIRFEIEKALYLARAGRPGPVWLDIPLDIQAATVETEDLVGFEPERDITEEERRLKKPADLGIVPDIRDEDISLVIDKLKKAERPVIFGGFGVRNAGAPALFRRLTDLLGIPVTVGASSVDLLPYDHDLYVGLSGLVAGRPGNFALQNSDVYLSIGSRQSLSQTGFNSKTWAREAYTILNDIDEEELKKPNLHVDLPLVGDAKDLLKKLVVRLEAEGFSRERPLFSGEKADKWRRTCRVWKESYPVVTAAEKGPMPDGRGNIYSFYDALSEAMPEGKVVLASCGTSRVAGTQAFRVKEGQRFITNSQTASMGYGLPAAVGISSENMTGEGRQEVTLITGEGSLMMNLQEMQTISTNHLPVRVFLMDNEGYHSIRQTQRNFFGGRPVGIGPESGDLSFPDFADLAKTFGFSYSECQNNATIKDDVKAALDLPLPALVRVRVSKTQNTEPKVSSRKLADGTMVSAPLEDMSPFLSREELADNMFIPLTREELEM